MFHALNIKIVCSVCYSTLYMVDMCCIFFSVLVPSHKQGFWTYTHMHRTLTLINISSHNIAKKDNKVPIQGMSNLHFVKFVIGAFRYNTSILSIIPPSPCSSCAAYKSQKILPHSQLPNLQRLSICMCQSSYLQVKESHTRTLK